MALLLSFWFLRKNPFKGKAPFFSTCFKFYTIDYTLPFSIIPTNRFVMRFHTCPFGALGKKVLSRLTGKAY